MEFTLAVLGYDSRSAINCSVNDTTTWLLRQYEDGLTTADRLAASPCRNNVRFVTAIEQYRTNRFDEAEMMKESLDDGTLNGRRAAQFAMGICNRVPWCPYPYPDY